MPVYLAEDPPSELFAFLNRSSLDKLSLTNHHFNRIVSSRFKNAPFRVLENVDIYCKQYRNRLDEKGIVAYIRRIFLKSCQIVRSRSSKDELNFLCKVVWDNRSITTSLNKLWNMITTEHTYARKLTLKIPTRRNGVRRNPGSDMVNWFWLYMGDLLFTKFCVGALCINARDVTLIYQSDNPELLLSRFRPALQNCLRITIRNHLSHLLDLLDLMFDSDCKRRLVFSWNCHTYNFSHHFSDYVTFFFKLEERFQSATSIVPFKLTFQFYGYLEEEIVDYVNNYSSIINSKAAKMLNIEAEEASSQITVSVEEQEQEY